MPQTLCPSYRGSTGFVTGKSWNLFRPGKPWNLSKGHGQSDSQGKAIIIIMLSENEKAKWQKNEKSVRNRLQYR